MTTTHSRSRCLSLELHSEGERISGRLGDDQGNDWRFACWLDLLTLIERVHAGAESGALTTIAPERREVGGAVEK
jgi:hypothetical protein